MAYVADTFGDDVAGFLHWRKPFLFSSRPTTSPRPRHGRRMLSIAALGLAAACATQRTDRAPADSTRGDAAHAPTSDDFGHAIPRAGTRARIVSLNPATTELLFAMGAGDRLVGRSRWDEWPRAALAVPALGDAIRPSVEQVLSARPDVVILYATADNRGAAARLNAAGVATIAFRIDRARDFDRAARLIGLAIGDSSRAAAVADSVIATLRRVRAATAGLPHPTVVWPVSLRPPMVAGAGSFMNDLIAAAGARNVYGDVARPSPVVSLEDLARRDPERVIVGSPDATLDVERDPAWRVIEAVRARRIVRVPRDLTDRPSVRMGEAALALARALHPGVRLP